jgi:hypothetical protein
MRMSAQDQHALGVVDLVVPEPGEGAHDDPAETGRRLKAIVVDRLAALEALTIDELLAARYRRYRSLGAYTSIALPDVPERPDRSLADRLRDLLDPARRAGHGPDGPAATPREPPAREEV